MPTNKIFVELFKIAKETANLAYAPYSNFKVGAALLTEEDTVYTGVNIENASYGATICAERVAVSKAISEGKQRLEAIAVYSEGTLAWPCGICRQFIYEFNPEIIIIVGMEVLNFEKWICKYNRETKCWEINIS